MKLSHFTCISAGALLMLCNTAVIADKYLVTYEDIDANADGWIDKIEASQRDDLLKEWTLIDSNSDGIIDVVEYLNYEARDYEPPYDSQDMDPGAGPL